MNNQKPLYLMADSQLLFWKNNEKLFLQRIRDQLTEQKPKAAYIGASNGDNPVYYEIFSAAMETIGITQHRMISAFFDEEEQAYLAEAELILLAGGDVERGWKTFQAVGLDKALINKYQHGCTLIGVSAGAMQLGYNVLSRSEDNATESFNTLQLVPLAISAHQEKEDWQDLIELLKLTGSFSNGIGIPTGGGMVYHPDFSVEPIRYPLHEVHFDREKDILSTNTIYPPNESTNL